MRNTLRNILFVLLIGGAVALFASDRETNVSGQPTLPTRDIVVNGHRLIVVEIADDDIERERGLSFRERLGPDHGMLFAYDASERLRFWMHGMKFPLDLIFIRDGRVVSVAADVPITTAGVPTVVWPEEEADQVLELNAGDAKRFDIRVGTEIEMQP